MTDGTFTLVDARGRKYLTRAERERFLTAARAHPRPGVQTLARTLAMTGCRVSEALGDPRVRCRPRGGRTPNREPEAPDGPLAGRSGPRGLVHAVELVHRLRRLQGSARGATRPLWPITRQTANRQVGAVMRTAGIEGPQACPRAFATATASPLLPPASRSPRSRPSSDTPRSRQPRSTPPRQRSGGERGEGCPTGG